MATPDPCPTRARPGPQWPRRRCSRAASTRTTAGETAPATAATAFEYDSRNAAASCKLLVAIWLLSIFEVSVSALSLTCRPPVAQAAPCGRNFEDGLNVSQLH